MPEVTVPIEAPESGEEEAVPGSWGSYSWYLLRKAGRGTWAALHYVGEKLAYGLGITSPDWQYAIDIYEDMKQEEQEEREEEEKALRAQRELVERHRAALLEKERVEEQGTALSETNS